MPLLHLHIAARHDPALAERAAAVVHRHTVEQLGKRSELIAVSVSFVDPGTWFIGGRALAGSGRRSFALEVKVTDETNTKAEKVDFIAAVFASLEDCLGPLHAESYVHVHDARAAAYGYGGRTQEWRHHRSAVTQA